MFATQYQILKDFKRGLKKFHKILNNLFNKVGKQIKCSHEITCMIFVATGPEKEKGHFSENHWRRFH